MKAYVIKGKEGYLSWNGNRFYWNPFIIAAELMTSKESAEGVRDLIDHSAEVAPVKLEETTEED